VSLEELEERVSRLEREVRRLRRRLAPSQPPPPEPIMEEDGVMLVESGDMFGSYSVIDRDGTEHRYGSLRDAEKTFRLLVGKRAGAPAP
jgi:hypothetical protein